MKRTTLTLLAVTTMASLTACGNSDDTAAAPVADPTAEYTVDSIFSDDAETEAPAEEPTASEDVAPKSGPVETVAAFLAALTDTNIGQACENVTDEFVEQIRFEQSVTDGTGCVETLTALVTRDGGPVEWQTAEPTLADSKARTALVEVTPEVSFNVVKQAGVWVIDSDPRSDWARDSEAAKKAKKAKGDKAEKPGKSDKSDDTKPSKSNDTRPGKGTKPEDTKPTPAPEPKPTPVNTDRTGAARWVANWCSLNTTMSKGTVIGFMGEPTSTFGPDSSQPQIRWTDGKVKFTAFLKGTRVWQLQADYSGATPAQKRVLTCEAVRR